MKAYMSESTRRNPVGHGASFKDWDGSMSVALVSAEALSEARAILAETEPRQEQGMSGHWFQSRPNRQWQPETLSNDESGHLSGTAWAGHTALAEALAAFIGEGH